MAAVAPAFAGLGHEAARIGLQLGPDQVRACETYAQALVEATRSVNLTAITGLEAIAVKHFLDSFTGYAARAWSGHEKVVDVGSGAGFPGMALRIALPEISLVCVEATGKKARAIESFRDLLALEGVQVEAARAEELARLPAHRARYDVATARALGTLGLCAELGLPFLRVGGDLIVWKGRIEDEMPGLERALGAIGGSLVSVVATSALGLAEQLPGRALVTIRKARPTPERYPRTAAELKRRPW